MVATLIDGRTIAAEMRQNIGDQVVNFTKKQAGEKIEEKFGFSGQKCRPLYFLHRNVKLDVSIQDTKKCS